MKTCAHKGKTKFDSGQALFEFLLVVPIFILFLIGLTTFGKYFIVQIRLNQAVRYTAWLRTYGYGYQISNQDVIDETINFLTTGYPTLKKEKIKITEIAGGRKGGMCFGVLGARRIKLEVEYPLYVPRLLSSIGFPDPWLIRARTEVYP